MANSTVGQSRFIGGISDAEKEGIQSSFVWGRSVDFRSDPGKITLLPRTVKESGTIMLDMPKWGELVEGNTYIHGDAGYFYKRTTAGSITNIGQAPDSHGNGLCYYDEDGHLYFATDTTIGRYGPLNVSGATPQFVNDYFGSQGGVPTNTRSLDLEASSSQYGSAADSASLSITGNLSLEFYGKLESLPTSGNQMGLITKWTTAGNLRSYAFDISGTSGDFGDGNDGALTISSNTTQSPVDSACSGTAGTYTLTATNASFAAGEKILIIQMRGTGAGNKQVTSIASYTAGTITTVDTLNFSYSSTGSSKAQVILLPQYTDVTVDSGKTWTAKAWTGTVGGILAFLYNGTFTVNGSVSATGKGFSGAAAVSSVSGGKQGEGTTGDHGTISPSANGSGGGGGAANAIGSEGGAGGGNGAVGTGANGGGTGASNPTIGGEVSGSADLSTITLGGGGGSGGAGQAGGTGSCTSGAGGIGGGIVWAMGTTFTMGGAGSIVANGNAGTAGTGTGNSSGGGGGAGGSVFLGFQTGTLGTLQITASGGAGGAKSTNGAHGSATAGGAGAAGRVAVGYYTSVSGTTTPTLYSTQDNSFAANTVYQLRLRISSTGANEEALTKVVDITTGMWYRFQVSWQASTSTATFYINAASQGTATGALTGIYNGTGVLYIGSYLGTGSFYDGLVDDIRIWNTTRTAGEFSTFLNRNLVGTEAGIAAYYKLESAATDSTANANNLTLSGSPSYSIDVPYSGVTTRLDLDQSLDTSGNTYTTPTSISEAAGDRQTFVPAKDPQKSIEVLFATKGTGDVTLTVHDAQNTVIATKTVTNANLPASGDYEFIFSEAWSPVIGQTYHFHLTSTVNDATVTTTTSSSLETADFHTYYQFLMTDENFHPITRMLDFIAIGNGRYLATYNAITYTQNKLTFPKGYNVRALARVGQYLAIGVWRGTSITDYDDGKIFFWDGISTTYNFFIDVPEGGINALYGVNSSLFVWAGYKGDVLLYTVSSAGATKVKRLPKMVDGKYVEIFPGAVTMWNSLIHFGVAGNSDSSDIEKGVYSWGRLNMNYSNALGYDYPISTGNRGSSVKVGFVLPVQTKLLIGWQDGVNYGLDSVTPGGTPFESGTIELLIIEGERITDGKLPITVRADYKTLNDGEGIAVKYKQDRASTWTTSDNDVNDEETMTRQSISDTNRAREIQIAADITATGGTSPTLLGLYIEYEDGKSEEGI